MTTIFYGILLIMTLFSSSNGFENMIGRFSPPLSSTGENSADQSDKEFDDCKEEFSTIIGKDVSIVSQYFSYSEKWGYTMRVHFHSLAQSGEKLPIDFFVCWKKKGQRAHIAISPIDEID
jgi:hypothetical protein